MHAEGHRFESVHLHIVEMRLPDLYKTTHLIFENG